MLGIHVGLLCYVFTCVLSKHLQEYIQGGCIPAQWSSGAWDLCKELLVKWPTIIRSGSANGSSKCSGRGRRIIQWQTTGSWNRLALFFCHLYLCLTVVISNHSRFCLMKSIQNNLFFKISLLSSTVLIFRVQPAFHLLKDSL